MAASKILSQVESISVPEATISVRLRLGGPTGKAG